LASVPRCQGATGAQPETQTAKTIKSAGSACCVILIIVLVIFLFFINLYYMPSAYQPYPSSGSQEQKAGRHEPVTLRQDNICDFYSLFQNAAGKPER
jgi:hypothetical protein